MLVKKWERFLRKALKRQIFFFSFWDRRFSRKLNTETKKNRQLYIWNVFTVRKVMLNNVRKRHIKVNIHGKKFTFPKFGISLAKRWIGKFFNYTNMGSAWGKTGVWGIINKQCVIKVFTEDNVNSIKGHWPIKKKTISVLLIVKQCPW